MKKRKHIFTREILIFTRSPEQYNEEFNTEEIRDISEYEGSVVVFDILEHNQKQIDPFIKGGRHKDLDVYYLSLYFDLPKRTTRNNSNKIILFRQTLKDAKTFKEMLLDLI